MMPSTPDKVSAYPPPRLLVPGDPVCPDLGGQSPTFDALLETFSSPRPSNPLTALLSSFLPCCAFLVCIPPPGGKMAWACQQTERKAGVNPREEQGLGGSAESTGGGTASGRKGNIPTYLPARLKKGGEKVEC